MEKLLPGRKLISRQRKNRAAKGKEGHFAVSPASGGGLERLRSALEGSSPSPPARFPAQARTIFSRSSVTERVALRVSMTSALAPTIIE